MSLKERLIIPFRGLKDGSHSFNFSLNDKYFEALDYSEIKKGNLSIALIIDKKPQHSLLKFEIVGTIEVICDRCLDDLKMNIKFKNEIFFKPSEEVEGTSEEYIIYRPEDDSIDITHYIYESIVLSLPYQRVHKNKSDCNKDMVKRLKEFSGKKAEKMDPRWDKLK